MRISFAHIRERSTSGGWIHFAVFDARSSTGTDDDNADCLLNLTLRARAADFKIDKAALSYREGGHIRFYGAPDLVDYLSKRGVPRWTHYLET